MTPERLTEQEKARLVDYLAQGIPYNAGGETRFVKGPLVFLGWGVDRKRGKRNRRPMFWYFALGYLSGFPIRWCLWWCWNYVVLNRSILGVSDV